MAGERDVKRRIKSVENTRQITRTMELVATSKMKRATDRVHAARPYASGLQDIVRGLYSPGLADRYPILRRPEETKRAAVLLLTANRGLCGAFNSNLIRQARDLIDKLRADGIETELHIAGKKGVASTSILAPFKARTRKPVTAETGMASSTASADASADSGRYAPTLEGLGRHDKPKAQKAKL